MKGVGRGLLSAIVWPAYVGALNMWGEEPELDYQRGQIFWTELDELTGSARILVPKGVYTSLAYYYHPVTGIMVGHQHLTHPFNFLCPGQIDIAHITQADFTQLPTPRGYRLPLDAPQCL